MPSLSAMRQIEPKDDALHRPLGPPIRPEPPAKMPDKLTPTGTPGVFEREDGKLETRLPTPPRLSENALESAILQLLAAADYRRECVKFQPDCIWWRFTAWSDEPIIFDGSAP